MRRLIRFGLEAAFLGALAVALVFAEAEPLVIVGAMLAGWLVVALFEWAGTRSRPHYGSGLPPRYYVPQVSLPPARPLEQLPAFPVPGDREDEATWIATPDVRAAVYGSAAVEDWAAGVSATSASPPAPAPTVSEDTMVDELLPITLHEHRPDPWLDGPLEPEEPAQIEPPPEPPVEEPVEEAVVEELPAEEPVAEAAPAEEPPDAEPADGEPAEEALAVAATAVAVASGSELARHRLDPLAEPAPRRRLSRRAVESGVVVEVPARPDRPTALPGRASREQSERA